MTQLHKGNIQLAGQDIEQTVLVHITKVCERFTKLTPGAFLLAQGRHQLLLSDDIILDQQVA